MRCRQWIWCSVILAGSAALPASFARSANRKPDSFVANIHGSDKGFRQKTDQQKVDFEVAKAATRARLSVEIRLPEGVMRFRLVDPAGKERLQGEVRSGNGTFDTREIPAIAGIWKLTLERENASGSYETHWRVR